MNRLNKFIRIPAITTLIIIAVFFCLILLQQNSILQTAKDNMAQKEQGQMLFTTLVTQSSIFQLPLQTPLPCYGPHLLANVSETEANINDTITVSGKICPPEQNATVEITFIRPDYTYINLKALADNQTGEFSVNQTVDMVGFWNIFPLENHITDRLWVNVTDPSGALLPPTVAHRYGPPPYTNYVLPLGIAGIAAGAILLGITFYRKDKTKKISNLRLLVQIAFVLLIFTGLFLNQPQLPAVPNSEISAHELLVGTNIYGGPLPDGLPLPAFACYYSCGRTVICPLWQVQTYIYPFWNVGHGWAVNYDISGLERIALVIGLVVLASVILGRVWCGWVCPFGLYIDVVSRIRSALRIKHRNLAPPLNEKLHQLSYIILAVTILLCVIFASQAITGTQIVSGTQPGGFVYTYFSAPFCQVCPMKPLCLLLASAAGTMKSSWVLGTTTGQFYQLGYYVTSLNVAVLTVVTAAAFFFRRSWCRICPLGGLIALFNRFPPFKWVSGVRLEKSEEKCTKCGVCKRVCPTQVTNVYEQKGGDVANSRCLMCLRCVEMCPEKDALKFKFAGKTVAESRNWLKKD
ncbi:MAG TPA: 4Fe-4S binding protein [Candidatus Nanoarchaeia archaeon]|nr:4Fe-4S binding protein [Candidatus Nanoarchaeia archaeon]